MISPIHCSWSILLQTVTGASRSLFLFILLTHTSQAIIDTNLNGVSDPWERAYNSGSLITNFDPQADTDGDGWSNGTEAISGTDPFDRIAPKGIIPLQILQTPAVYITGPTGDPEIFTPAAVSITWPTFAGKQYTLFASVDLTAGSWLAIDNDTPRIGTTAPMGNSFPISQPDGSTPPAMFYRLAISDADSDGDTLTNHEEAQLNTDPFSIDTDRDGLPDNIDPAPLSSATLSNPDGANAPVGSTTNLLGFWDFESQNPPATPVVFPDKSGNDRHAAGTTGPQALGLPSLAGRIGPGAITVPSTTINGSPTYTVTGWFKLGKDTIKNSSTTIFKSLYAIYDRGGAGPSPQLAPLGQGTGLFIRKSTTGGEEWFVGGYRQTTFPNGNALTDFNGHYFPRPAGTSDDAKWHHFAVTRSATSFGQKVYFDGVLIIERPLLEYSVSHDPVPPPIPAQATTFTFGALYPGHGPSTFLEAFIDRVRVQSRLLTTTEILGYYRQDIDQDGLWDTTETSTALWRDTNSNGQASATEFSYSSSPFHWQPTNTDTDSDGLIDTVEQNLGTQISNPDTDGDLLPDGWEVTYQLNPLIANNANDDTDLDGLGLLDEYRYNTNPTLANTDGDPQNDGPEVAHNSNPNDASDGGNPTPADQQLSILLGIGDESDSHSEDYVLHCYRLDPQTGQEQRFFTFRSGGYGEYKEDTFHIFKKGESYTFQIDWQSSNLGYQSAAPGVTAEGPDYDYTFKVQPQGSNTGLLIDAYDPKTKTIGNSILAVKASNVVTTESEFKENYERKRIALINLKLEWQSIYGDAFLEPHLEPSTNQINGSRWFPDQPNPDASGVRDIIGIRISGGLPNMPIWLQSIDVDDSTNDAVIDTNGNFGFDNTVEGFTSPGVPRWGTFVTPTPKFFGAASGNLNANGELLAKLRVGASPGNNYRVAASLIGRSHLDPLHTNPTSADQASYVSQNSSQLPNFSGSITQTLTIWRKLWLEIDTMGSQSSPPQGEENWYAGSVTNILSSTTTDAGQPASQYPLGSPCWDCTFECTIDRSLAEFENGWLISGATNTAVPVQKAYHNSSGQTVIRALEAPGSVGAYTLLDDDNSAFPAGYSLTLPISSVDYSYLASKFAFAYIKLVPAANYNDVSVVSFDLQRNVVSPEWNNSIDVDESPMLWATMAVIGYQPLTELSLNSEDGDPNTEARTGGNTDRTALTVCSSIFVETIRDELDELLRLPNLQNSQKIDLLHNHFNLTIAHEIGHQPSGRSTNDHIEDGIMVNGGSSGNDVDFTSATLARFRKTTRWSPK